MNASLPLVALFALWLAPARDEIELPKGFVIEKGEVRLPNGVTLPQDRFVVACQCGNMVLVATKDAIGVYNPGKRSLQWSDLDLPQGAILDVVYRTTGELDPKRCFLQVKLGEEVKGVVRFEPPHSLLYFPLYVPTGMPDPPAPPSQLIGWMDGWAVSNTAFYHFYVSSSPDCNVEVRLKNVRGKEILQFTRLPLNQGDDRRPFRLQYELRVLTRALHETQGEHGQLVVKDMHLVPKADGTLDPVTRGIARWRYDAFLRGEFQINAFGGMEVKGPKYQEQIKRNELILEHGVEPREIRPGKMVAAKITSKRRTDIEEELEDYRNKQKAALTDAGQSGND